MNDETTNSKRQASMCEGDSDSSCNGVTSIANGQVAVVKVAPVIVCVTLNIDGKQYVYDPQPDITAYEVARMLEWFVCHTAPTSWRANVAFLKEHNLLRHWREDE